jgi:hypothetical protein
MLTYTIPYTKIGSYQNMVIANHNTDWNEEIRHMRAKMVEINKFAYTRANIKRNQ